jgi:Bacteriocin-protection, YdeI or OmpD-Associated
MRQARSLRAPVRPRARTATPDVVRPALASSAEDATNTRATNEQTRASSAPEYGFRAQRHGPEGAPIGRDTHPRLPVAHYPGPVSGQQVPGGVVHTLPADLRRALIANATALDAWKDITPLARNEFICWVEDAKQETTRERRIRRTQEELEEGQRRPCCWPGCKHRDRTGR